MRIRYLPGDYPVPMLAVEYKPNEEVYQAFLKDEEFLFRSEDLFTKSYNHIFNMNAYIIYDEQELLIKCYRMTSFPHFVYLLRTLGKALEFNITSDQYALIKQELENYFDQEFEVYVE